MRGEPIRALTQNSKGAAPWAKFHWGDKACTLSHVKCWKEFLDSGDSHAAILEDDVVLRDGAGIVLKDAAWIPKAVGLVKLEHYGPARQSVPAVGFHKRRARLSTGAHAFTPYRGGRLYPDAGRGAAAVGGAALQPAGRPSAVQSQQFTPVRLRCRPGSCCRRWRGSRISSATNRISKAGGSGMRKLTPGYAKRELIRFGYDLKLLPRQLGLVLSGRAKFTRMLDKAGSPSPRPALTRKPRR